MPFRFKSAPVADERRIVFLLRLHGNFPPAGKNIKKFAVRLAQSRPAFDIRSRNASFATHQLARLLRRLFESKCANHNFKIGKISSFL